MYIVYMHITHYILKLDRIYTCILNNVQLPEAVPDTKDDMESSQETRNKTYPWRVSIYSSDYTSNSAQPF